MLARIAQQLFWFGRDLVRAEQTARMLDGAFHADVAGGAPRGGISLSWEAIFMVIGAKPPMTGGGSDLGADAQAAQATPALPTIPGIPSAPARVAVARMLTVEPENPASIVSCVARARERGRTLRDVISTEMWSALNAFYLSHGGGQLEASLAASPYSALADIKEQCALFWGLAERTMLRDEGRSFLEAGGRIEAADMLLRLLRVAVPPDSDAAGHEAEALALLHAVGGFQAYRRAVQGAPSVSAVARFLLYERQYPGSVASSIETLHAALGEADEQPRTSPPVLRLGRLIADLELQRRTEGVLSTLADTLMRVQDELALIDRDIDDHYFAVAAAAAVHR